MKKNTLFGFWIFLSSLSFWLPCGCKSVSQEEDMGLIESVMNAAGINASTMTTQRSVFNSESGLMKGEAAVAAPIQSSDANSTAIVNATAFHTSATSEGKLEPTVDSHASNITEKTTTPSSQMTSSENTNVTMAPEHVETTIASNNLTLTENVTETPLTPESVTASSTTPKVEHFSSTTISSVEATTKKEDENQTEETTMKPTMINSNETDPDGQTDSGYFNLSKVSFKIKDVISSLFHMSKNLNAPKSSGETTEFTLKVNVNWLYNNLTLSW